MKRLILVLAIGCGGGDSSGADASGGIDSPGVDAPPDTVPLGFAMTSPMLAEGAPFAVENTCDGANNSSPQLDWVGKPGAALSFAVVFTDNTNGLIHSVIYDIPAMRDGLPADVDKVFAPPDVPGAHQTRTLGNGVNPRGYFGPCPPQVEGPHTYEFALFALDVAALPGADMNTTKEQAKQIILQHDLATTLLTGTRDR